MAIYHLNASFVSRASTNSSCAHAAYITAEKATDVRTGESFDYRNKASEVAHKNILLPEGMEHLNTTEKLWNAIEEFEDKIAEERYGNYKDPVKQAKSLAAKAKFLAEAATAFKMECALPKELKLNEKIELSDRIAKEIFGSKNLIVQYALHDKEDNPHVHYACNFRQVINGEFSKRKMYFLSSDIKEMRKSVADIINSYGLEKGYEFAVDHRSNLDRGIKVEPTKHRGWYASELGDNSRIVLENREILSTNTASLLKDPEELIKVLIDGKTVFNIDELKGSAKERFGTDEQTWHVLQELITKDNAKILIDRAAKFGSFLEVAKEVKEISFEEKDSLSSDDIAELKELKDAREKLADEIFKGLKDYKWLMSKVGMGEDSLEAMTSSGTISWNDRSEFLGGDVPQNLRAGDALAALSKAFGVKELDRGLASVFNLENLGESFKKKDAYIANSDLEVEEEIIKAKSVLSKKEFGGNMPLKVRMLGRRPVDNIHSIIKSQEKSQGYKFSCEQKEAAISLVAEKAYGSLIGKAGTGKTTTLRSVAQAYHKAGFRVIGTSFQGAAVGELGLSLGEYMDAGFTLTKLRNEWGDIDKGRSKEGRIEKYELTDKTVVILDEAGMASASLVQPLLDRAREKGSKVIVVGDSGQISSISRADIGRLLFDGGDRLENVVRQKDKSGKVASDDFANGYIENGIASYKNRGDLVIGENDFSTKLSLIGRVSEKIKDDIAGGSSFREMIIAYKNSDVEDINLGMQTALRKQNRLTGQGITILTGYYKSLKAGRLGSLLSNPEIKESLDKIRGNVVPIKGERSISYKEAFALLKNSEKDGSDQHKLLSDILKPKLFFAGDKIKFGSNFNKGIDGKTVYNGTLGVIQYYSEDEHRLEVFFEDKSKAKIDLQDYHSLDLGYAITVNGSQGKNTENCHFFVSNTKGARIGSREFYVGATRHINNLTFYTSKEYLNGTSTVGGIKINSPQETQLHQKIEERWKMTAHDLSKDNPDLQLARDLEKISNEKHKLWSLMQKDVRAGHHDLFEHPHFDRYKQVKGELKEMAETASNNWGNVRIYASHAKITSNDIKRWSGDKKEHAEENKDFVKYKEYQREAQELWVDILKTKKTTPSGHEKYPEFKRASQSRNELAYKLASFGSEHEIHDREGDKTITHIYNHVQKNEWKNIQRHSALYIKEKTKSIVDQSKGGAANIASSDKQSQKQELYQAQKELWDIEHLELKDRIEYRAEVIARDLLGEPNNKFSNKNELRYGKSGKLAVTIKGEKAGTWYNFESGEGGDMFRLAGETRCGDFKNSAEYLRSMVGMSASQISSHLISKRIERSDDLVRKEEEQKARDEKDSLAKIEYAEKLYEKSKDIGTKSIAHRYLTNIRNLNVELSSDIRTTGIYDKERKECFPALVAFSRDKHGDITGGQHICLDKENNIKADIAVPKRSFGTISGSFVNLGNINTKADSDNNLANEKQANITIISEGIETGLSVKQALGEHSEKNTTTTKIKTLCSLGVGNIKNYAVNKGEKIIIASDNDGKDSITDKTIETAKSILEEKGAFVEVVKPEREGDFNDILQDKENGGSKVIADCFKHSIAKHSAVTVDAYLALSGCSTTLSKEERSDLAYLEKYNIDQKNLVDSYRTGSKEGGESLKALIAEDIENCFSMLNSRMESLEKLNNKIDRNKIASDIREMNYEERKQYINGLIASEAKKYISPILEKHEEEKSNANNIKDMQQAIASEHKFYLHLYREHRTAITVLGKKEGDSILLVRASSANSLDKNGGIKSLESAISHTVENGIKDGNSVMKDIRSANGDMYRLNFEMHYNAKSHYSKMIDRNLETIDHGIPVTLGSRTFNNAQEYLKHLKDDHKHEFMPSNKIDDHLKSLASDNSKNQTKQQELEKSKEMKIEKNHDLSL